MAMDTGFAGFGGALFAIVGIWSIVGLGAYIWYLWSLARLFPYLGLPAVHGWIPVWNQWRLIERGGLPGWVAVLGLVPGLNLVAIVVSIVAIHRINLEHGEGGGMTVLGALLPPLWATLLGSRFQDRAYATGGAPRGGGPAQGTLGLVEYGPDGTVYPLLQGQAAPASPPQFSMPPVPPSFDAEAGGAAAQPTQGAAQPLAGPGLAAAAPSAPPPAPSPAEPPAAQAPGAEAQTPTGAFENPWGFGKTTEGNFQRLASEQLPSREHSFGGATDARPFAWPQPAGAPTAPPASTPAGPEPAKPNPAKPNPAKPEAAEPELGEPEHAAPAAADAHPGLPAQSAPGASAPGASAQGRAESEELFFFPTGDAAAAQLSPAAHAPLAAPEASEVPVAPVAPVSPEVPVAPVAPEAPAAPVAPVAPAAPAAPQQAQATADATPHPPVAGESEAEAGVAGEDDDLDRTVVVSRRPRWALELPDGRQLPLSGDDVVIGRKPAPVEGSEVLMIPDSTRTLSKSHARLRRRDGGWTIEDLQSTNGVFTVDADGQPNELAPGVPTPATERLIVGTLEIRVLSLG